MRRRLFNLATAISLLCMAIACATGCAGADDTARWQQEENRKTAELISLCEEGEKVNCLTLSVSEVVRLGGGTLVLGGSYGTPAGAVRSAILVSVDNGRTWRDAGVAIAGSTVVDFVVLDERHAWAVVCWTMESTTPPYYVLRTADGGRTWHRSHIPLPSGDEGLWDLWQWSFTDARHGTLALNQTAGRWRVQFVTSDGGERWRLLKTISIDPDPADGPRSPQPTNLRADAVEQAGVFRIQQSDDGGKTWQTLGTVQAKQDRFN